jgi:hypothetical protein
MGKRNPDKKLIQIWLHKDVIAKLDKLGSNRTETIRKLILLAVVKK